MKNVKNYLLNDGARYGDVESITAALTTEELCGQLLCLDIYEKNEPAEVEKVISRIKPGGIFVSSMSAEKIKLYTDMANRFHACP